MTKPQIDAISRIREIVREHFDGSVIIVSGTPVGEEDGKPLEDTAADIEYIFHGGYAQAIGLLELAKIHVWKRGVDQSESEVKE